MKYRNVEFYNTPDGEVMIKEENKAARTFTEMDRELIDDILSLIRDRYTQAYNQYIDSLGVISVSTTNLTMILMQWEIMTLRKLNVQCEVNVYMKVSFVSLNLPLS